MCCLSATHLKEGGGGGLKGGSRRGQVNILYCATSPLDRIYTPGLREGL